jgi:hypothetical protein
MTCTCFPDDARTDVAHEIQTLHSRIAELNDALSASSPRLFGSTWWLERLEAAAAARRQIERLQLLLED